MLFLYSLPYHTIVNTYTKPIYTCQLLFLYFGFNGTPTHCRSYGAELLFLYYFFKLKIPAFQILLLIKCLNRWSINVISFNCYILKNNVKLKKEVWKLIFLNFNFLTYF